jgi:glycosyltransferase involved in cell wall biosynthesis
MEISIIIPTLNEEEYLPKLLESIKNQTFKDYEVIVADSGSKDNTAEIAKNFGAKVVSGGMPAVGRNAGAKAANVDFLFFFDADVKLPKDFLEKAYTEMQERYLDIATSECIPLSNIMIDKVMFDFANFMIKTEQFSEKPYIPGSCILVTRRLFDRLVGFDETLKMAEDHEFVKRASSLTSFRVLKSVKFWVSVRRLRKEGRFELAWKYFLVEVHRNFKGELREDIINYEFANYDNENKKSVNKRLRDIEKRLNLMSRNYTAFAKKYLSRKAINGKYKEKLREFKKQIKARMHELNNAFKVGNNKNKKLKS